MCFRIQETYACGCVMLSEVIWCDYARSIGRQCANVAIQGGPGSVHTYKCPACGGKRQADNDESGAEESDDDDEEE